MGELDCQHMADHVIRPVLVVKGYNPLEDSNKLSHFVVWISIQMYKTYLVSTLLLQARKNYLLDTKTEKLLLLFL